MSRKNRSPEENARRAKIRDSMDDIQNLFKERRIGHIWLII